MNKKLLMSSALVGSLALASAAVAETKITGSAQFTYSVMSAGTAAASTEGFGREVQLDIANSGDLNVGGLKYAAGFSIEADGGANGTTGADFSEGNYFGIISGGTELRFNVDKAPSMSQSATPRVGQHLTTQAAPTGTNIYAYSPGKKAADSFNTALIQNTDVGQFALVYAPKIGDTGGNNDNVAARTSDGGNILDIVYSGNLGVKGLKAVAGYGKLEKQTGAAEDTTAKQLGLSYNFGQIAAGVTRNDSTTNAGIDTTSDEFGVTFAANDKLSLGVLYASTDTSTPNTTDEKITSVGLAYNLGGAAFEMYYLQIENQAGAKNAGDIEKATVRISTKF
jgi:hypothetical protein